MGMYYDGHVSNRNCAGKDIWRLPSYEQQLECATEVLLNKGST